MIQMVTDDDENKNKPYDELGELLKKHYKPDKELNSESFTKEVFQKIDSLFHKGIFSEKGINEAGHIVPDEDRYWLGLQEYINNEISSLKHKVVTEHLLKCKECRKNYDTLLDKKKTNCSLNLQFDSLILS